MSKVLVIVDVQKEFDKFIQHDLVDELYDYAKTFKKVYQIWDTHKNDVAPTYEFPNQVDTIKKKYGKNHFSDNVRKFIDEVKNQSFEGNTYKLSNNEGYIVRVDNNHEWFYVNPEIVELIEKIQNDKIILVGGADQECLEDVYQAFKAFGLNVHINKKFVYSAKTSNKDSIEDTINERYTEGDIFYIIYANGRENVLKLEDFMHKNGYSYRNTNEKYILKKYFSNITEISLYDINPQKGIFDGILSEATKSNYTTLIFPNDIDKIRKVIQGIPDYTPRKIERSLESYNTVNEGIGIEEPLNYCIYADNRENSLKLEDFMHKLGYSYLSGNKYIINSIEDINDITITSIYKKHKLFNGFKNLYQPDNCIVLNYPKDLGEILKVLIDVPNYQPKKMERTLETYNLIDEELNLLGDDINDQPIKYCIYAGNRENSLKLEDFMHKNGYHYSSKSFQSYILKDLPGVDDITISEIKKKDKTFNGFRHLANPYHYIVLNYPSDIDRIKNVISDEPNYKPRKIKKLDEWKNYLKN